MLLAIWLCFSRLPFLTLFQLKIKYFHPLWLALCVRRTLYVCVWHVTILDFFRCHIFDLHKNREEEEQDENNVVYSWAFHTRCNEYHIILFMRRQYISDWLPIKYRFFLLSFLLVLKLLSLLLLLSARSSALFVRFICFLLFPFTLSPRSIILGSKESLCVMYVFGIAFFNFALSSCVWLWFFFLFKRLSHKHDRM